LNFRLNFYPHHDSTIRHFKHFIFVTFHTKRVQNLADLFWRFTLPKLKFNRSCLKSCILTKT
jgi:hypothetical protein